MAPLAQTPSFISRMLASGGDGRIRIKPGASTNIYGASPFPREMLAYAATTANDISLEAFEHLQDYVRGWTDSMSDGAAYGAALETLRTTIRSAYRLTDTQDIVFAPSGTDLEFVALHLAAAASGKPVTNILLGADEVGSGCGLAASGCYFATETVLADAVTKGAPVSGLEGARIVDVPVRDKDGRAFSSTEVSIAVAAHVETAIAEGRHALVHVVHGSKTGLTLPALAEIDGLRERFGSAMTLVIDACQARITKAAIADYLARGAIVFLTGSKFMGGPPFAGFAILPDGMATATPLPTGFTTLFRRAEWPEGWAGTEMLPDSANPGLLLRLEAALFELRRFTALPDETVEAVSAVFGRATRHLARSLGAGHICPTPNGDQSATMATLDLTTLPCAPDFETAQRWQRVLAARGIRLGQPVKCVRLPDGRWGGTLRISLSMPTIVALAALPPETLEERLMCDMESIAEILGAAAKPVAA